MEASTLEQSSGDASPVFVAGGRHRSHAVRLAAATLGLLLAVWLAALVAGLVGFSPLPKLTFPGTGAARAPATAPEQGSRPAVERDAGTHASPVASRPERGVGQVNAHASAGASGSPRASGGRTGVASGQTAGGNSGTTSPGSGGDAPPAPSGGDAPPAPSGGAASPSSSGRPPSFTPPASGEKSASPPRGNSADAPGRAVSADPPGRAARPHSG